jgi:hypothetical protein
MRTFGRSAGGGRRKTARKIAPLFATLKTLNGDHRAALINISRAGALFSGPDLPNTDEDVVFKADNIEALGRVIWSNVSQCGIAFDRILPPDQVDYLREHADRWIFAGSPDGDALVKEV